MPLSRQVAAVFSNLTQGERKVACLSVVSK